jgi:ATP-dependent helicase/DNAse subunit B
MDDGHEGLERISFNQSRIKIFNQCPKKFDYKYNQLLEPKRKVRPLFLGSWIHAALETHYRDGDWTIGHNEYVKEWDKLFDEEKKELAAGRGKSGLPFPVLVKRIMDSYRWYYRNDHFTPYMVEEILEVETPLKIEGKYFVFKGRLDLIMRDDDDGSLWLWDHKTASTIPQPTSFHGMDPQLMLYPWAAKQQFGIDIAGVYYNYVKSKPPSVPKLNQDGSLSKRKIVTDYPTAYRFLKQNGYDPNDFSEMLKPLARQSPFLRRYKLSREEEVTKNILLDTLSVVKRIDETKRWTRTITRDCVRCEYQDICRAELNGFDTTMMRQTSFNIAEEDYVIHGNSVATDDETDEDE